MDPAAVTRRVVEHVEAVGAVDIDRLRGLYALDARLYDSVGENAVVGRDAIGAHYARWLTAARRISRMQITVTGHDSSLVAVSFTATPDDGDPVDIIDVMRFGTDLLITEMSAFALQSSPR